MSHLHLTSSLRIGIVGLGYVGLPLAVAFAQHHAVVGYDIDVVRVAELRQGHDRTRGLQPDELRTASRLSLTTDAEALRGCTVFILTVPTPVTTAHQPDLQPLLTASATVANALKPGDVVVYESTVYPGCTEDDCVPVLERGSGLRCNHHFSVGYSPERLSPGQNSRRLTDMVKITSGSTPEATAFIDHLYRQIITAGTHRAPSIRVAEAAKLIENAQRDVNISFMNELVLLFDRLHLDTNAVLAAAGTKWNFLPFRPGLVGGHCISVDPYYLLHKAEQVGYTPHVIASGRRVNEHMPLFVAGKFAQLLTAKGLPLQGARVLVLGVTYKENCPDVRDSRVIEVIRELNGFGMLVDVADPWANAEEVQNRYGVALEAVPQPFYTAVLVAVLHDDFTPTYTQKFVKKPNQVVHLTTLWEPLAKT